MNLHFRVVFPKKVKKNTFDGGRCIPPITFPFFFVFYGFFLILFPFVGYNIFHPHLILCWRILNEKNRFFFYLFLKILEYESLCRFRVYIYTYTHKRKDKLCFFHLLNSICYSSALGKITNNSNQH